jgi:hypothetical protein
MRRTVFGDDRYLFGATPIVDSTRRGARVVRHNDVRSLRIRKRLTGTAGPTRKLRGRASCTASHRRDCAGEVPGINADGESFEMANPSHGMKLNPPSCCSVED